MDHPFKIGDFYIVPPIAMIDKFKNYNNVTMDTITKEEHNLLLRIVTNIDEYNSEIGCNAHIVFNDEYLSVETIQESFKVANMLANKANRALDYLRIDQCSIGSFEQLPGIAGVLNDGVMGVFQVIFKTESNLEISLLSSRVTMVIKDGLGLYPNCEFLKSDYQTPLYKSFFCSREDLVFKTGKNALHRVAEAFYMSDFNTAFIHLMSTLEMLANPNEFVKFQNAKSRILPFTENTKDDYHKMSGELKYISKNVRTEVVHNGKSLYDIYDSESEVIGLLNRIVSIIVRYVFAVN